MAKYKLNEITKTLDKLFSYGINTTENVANLNWQDLDKIGEFTPMDKSILMDFKFVIKENYKINKKKKIKNGLIEFLSGKNKEECD